MMSIPLPFSALTGRHDVNRRGRATGRQGTNNMFPLRDFRAGRQHCRRSFSVSVHNPRTTMDPGLSSFVPCEGAGFRSPPRERRCAAPATTRSTGRARGTGTSAAAGSALAEPGDQPAAVEARRRWLEQGIRGFPRACAHDPHPRHRPAAPGGSADDPGKPAAVRRPRCRVRRGNAVSRCSAAGPRRRHRHDRHRVSRTDRDRDLPPGIPLGGPRRNSSRDSRAPPLPLGPRRRCSLYGIDLSVAAIRLAAKSFPWATWIVANADRGIPLADRSCDLVLSLFGRRNPTEFRRVLRPGGHALVAVPGEDDLQELRAAILREGAARERAEAVVAEFGGRPGRTRTCPRAEGGILPARKQ